MTALFRLMTTVERKQAALLVSLSLAAGLLNAATLGLVNEMLVPNAGNGMRLAALAIGLGLAGLYYFFQTQYMMKAARLSNQIVVGLRNAFLSRLASTSYRDIETLDRAAVSTCINAEAQCIAESATVVTTLTQGLIVSTITLLYLSVISIPAAGIAFIIIVAISILYMYNNNVVENKFQKVLNDEIRFSADLREILDCADYLKLDERKMSHAVGMAGASAQVASSSRLEQQEMVTHHFATTESSFMAMLCITVGAAGFAGLEPREVGSLATALCFLLGPITMIGSAIPQLQRLSTAATALETLRASLPPAVPGHDGAPARFAAPAELRFRDVTYAYGTGQNKRILGPYSFQVNRGQLVLITGQNGAGKTTLVKLLTGLYLRSGGDISIDGTTVDPEYQNGYRDLFSAVYISDILLRDNVCLAAANPGNVNALLKDMELDTKVSFTDGRFSTHRLSTGQRKRLALISAIVDARPYLVCDEWDDTQDTYFRDKFYHCIVPRLKSEGKTIVIVSHNPQYRDQADQIVVVGSPPSPLSMS